jgi:hypothetical protein
VTVEQLAADFGVHAMTPWKCLRRADIGSGAKPGTTGQESVELREALRPVKTQLKISGCHQSADGATAWLAVRSYLDSARKHGLSAFGAIHRAFTGTLWMPPITQTT